MNQEKHIHSERPAELTPEVEEENKAIYTILCRISTRWQGKDPDTEGMNRLAVDAPGPIKQPELTDETIIIGQASEALRLQASAHPQPENDLGHTDTDETVIITSPTWNNTVNEAVEPVSMDQKSGKTDHSSLTKETSYDETIIIGGSPSMTPPVPDGAESTDDQTIIVSPSSFKTTDIDETVLIGAPSENAGADPDATLIIGAVPKTSANKSPDIDSPPPNSSQETKDEETVIMPPPHDDSGLPENRRHADTGIFSSSPEKGADSTNGGHDKNLIPEEPVIPDDDIKLETVILGPKDYE